MEKCGQKLCTASDKWDHCFLNLNLYMSDVDLLFNYIMTYDQAPDRLHSGPEQAHCLQLREAEVLLQHSQNSGRRIQHQRHHDPCSADKVQWTEGARTGGHRKETGLSLLGEFLCFTFMTAFVWSRWAWGCSGVRRTQTFLTPGSSLTTVSSKKVSESSRISPTKLDLVLFRFWVLSHTVFRLE